MYSQTSQEDVSMAEGRIKWYSEKKGYGFIVSEDESELFLHRSGIKQYGHFGLQKDDRVSFEIKKTPRGIQAVNVRAL